MCNSVFDLPNVTIPTPWGWSHEKNNAPCQNSQCPEKSSHIHDPDNTLRDGCGKAYSRGRDNGDGTITLAYAGFCLNCAQDEVRELQFLEETRI